MEIKKGGKRVGAGRKPLGLKKKSRFFYVEDNLVLKFGSEDKFKQKVYEFIRNYGEENLSDGKENKSVAHDEVGLWQEPKPNYFVPTATFSQTIILTKRQTYINDLNECRDYEEIKKVMLRSKGETLTNVDRQMLDVTVRNVMEEKGIEAY